MAVTGQASLVCSGLCTYECDLGMRTSVGHVDPVQLSSVLFASGMQMGNTRLHCRISVAEVIDRLYLTCSRCLASQTKRSSIGNDLMRPLYECD